MRDDFANCPVSRFVEVEKGHGRLEERRYYQITAPSYLHERSKWKGLKTIGAAVRTYEENGVKKTDTRYYLSSLRRHGERFANAVRNHWGVENSLHWSLDMTYREDESRVRNRTFAETLSWLRRFTLGVCVHLVRSRWSLSRTCARRARILQAKTLMAEAGMVGCLRLLVWIIAANAFSPLTIFLAPAIAQQPATEVQKTIWMSSSRFDEFQSKRKTLTLKRALAATPELTENDGPAVVRIKTEDSEFGLTPKSIRFPGSVKGVPAFVEALAVTPDAVSLSLHCDSIQEKLTVYHPDIDGLFRQIAALPCLQQFTISPSRLKIHPSYIETLCLSKSLRSIVNGDLSRADPQCFSWLPSLELLNVCDVQQSAIQHLVNCSTFRHIFVRDPQHFGGELTAGNRMALRQLNGRLRGFGTGGGSSVHPDFVREVSKIQSLESMSFEFISPALEVKDLDLIERMPHLKLLELDQPRSGSESERKQFATKYFQIKKEAWERSVASMSREDD